MGSTSDCHADGLITFADLNCRACTVTENGKTAEQTCRDTYAALRNAACKQDGNQCPPESEVTPAKLVAALKNGDSDSNGRADDIIGWDFSGGDKNPGITRSEVGNNDRELSHGSEMAGIIGALTDNSQDVAGTAWNVRLILIRTRTQGEDRIAFEYAAETLGADIINFSRGILALTGDAPVLPNTPDQKCPASYTNIKQADIDAKQKHFQDEFREIDLRGTMLVAAVSNCPLNVDDPGVFEWPVEAASDSVLTVATGGNASASGKDSVDVVGLGNPGWTLAHREESGRTSQFPAAITSSSMAAAYVSGVAALTLSAFPDLRGNARCLREFLIRNSRPDVSITKPVKGALVDMFTSVVNATPSPVPDGCPR